jgi:hypothetical protein
MELSRKVLGTAALAWVGSALAANPISVEPHSATPADLLWPVRASLIGFALLVELMVVGWLLGKLESRAYPRVLGAWVLMHLVTYPITWYLSGILGWKAELFPLAFEVWLFPQWSRLTVRQSWLPVLTGNAASFVLGLALPHIWVRLFLPKQVFY